MIKDMIGMHIPTLALLGGPKAMTAQICPHRASAIGEEDVAMIMATLSKGRLDALSALSGIGPVRELEEYFKSNLKARYALAVSSGTAALHTALAACGVQRGQEVILSPYDWGAGVAAVLAIGAVPVFADIDPLRYTLDPDSVSSRVGPRTIAILITHIFGHPAEMERMTRIAHHHRLHLVEDCAQALGAAYEGRPVGTFGDVGCFSLGWGKLVSGGEGGVLVSNSDNIFEAAVRFSQHPLRQEREGIDPSEFSLNYRMHPLAALIASTQIEKLDRRLKERRDHAKRLAAILQAAPGLRPAFVSQECTHAFHRYSPSYIASEWNGLPRHLVVSALAAEGVPISEGWIETPLNVRLRQCVLRRNAHRRWECPTAEKRCASEELGLEYVVPQPGDPDLRIKQLADAITKVHARRGDLARVARS